MAIQTEATGAVLDSEDRSFRRGQKGDTNVALGAGGSLVEGLSLIYRRAMMRSLSIVAMVLITVTSWMGCGDSRPAGTAGSDSSLVGGPCVDNLDCDERLCEIDNRFPDGVCTISCGESGHCPQGSSCAELPIGWVCIVNCVSAADCRTGYACQPVTEAGTNDGSTVTVCIGSARPS